MIPLSILDLSPITEGSDAAVALQRSLDLARHAERWGYHRFWVAEHHGMPGIASAATAVVLAHLGSGTQRIRLGAGGIMLPNHAPLVIAEQFGTLASLFPGRIDLGLGRAPGTDQVTMRALRRTLAGDVDEFPEDVRELIAYFEDPQPGQRVRAIPGAGLKVPVWILGSSTFGAQLAAMFGLPYAFASHFAPAQMDEAVALYRARFRPSPYLEAPRVMLAVNVFAADREEDARLMMTSVQQMFVALRRGLPGKLPPPVRDFEQTLDDTGRAILEHALSCTVVGTPPQVRDGLAAFVRRTGADDLILACAAYDHAARLRSYEIAASSIVER
jgi:luciferase family oxidoreductase group 1